MQAVLWIGVKEKYAELGIRGREKSTYSETLDWIVKQEKTKQEKQNAKRRNARKRKKQLRVSDASPALFSLEDDLDQQKFRDSVKEIGVDEYVRRLGELYKRMFPEDESGEKDDQPEN